MTRPDALARVQAQHAPALARCPAPCQLAECECCTDEESDEPAKCSECWHGLDDAGHCPNLCGMPRRARLGARRSDPCELGEYSGPMPECGGDY